MAKDPKYNLALELGIGTIELEVWKMKNMLVRENRYKGGGKSSNAH